MGLRLRVKSPAHLPAFDLVAQPFLCVLRAVRKPWVEFSSFLQNSEGGRRGLALPLPSQISILLGVGHAPSQPLISCLTLTQRKDPRDALGSCVSPEFLCLFS